MTPLSYHLSSLSLIALVATRLLVQMRIFRITAITYYIFLVACYEFFRRVLRRHFQEDCWKYFEQFFGNT